MNRGDLSALDDLLAAEFVGHVRLPPAPTMDREGVKALFATYRSAFSGFHATTPRRNPGVCRYRFGAYWT